VCGDEGGCTGNLPTTACYLLQIRGDWPEGARRALGARHISMVEESVIVVHCYCCWVLALRGLKRCAGHSASVAAPSTCASRRRIHFVFEYRTAQQALIHSGSLLLATLPTVHIMGTFTQATPIPALVRGSSDYYSLQQLL
jgi:hypothetical protein